MATRNLTLLTVTCLGVGLVPAPGRAQGRVPTVNPERQATFPEPFSSIVGVRELQNGRVMIADRVEQHVSVLDFRTGSMDRIGREGQGPGEYQTPINLFPLPNGRTLLVDMGNTRMTIIEADFAMGESYPMMRQDGGMLFVRPEGTDNQGHVYFSSQGLIMAGPGGPSAPPDSGAVIRLNLNTDVMDTVAQLTAPPRPSGGTGGGQIRVQGGGSFSVAGMMPAPFAPRDGWAVQPDGSVMVVRTTPYRVDRYQPDGRAHTGPTISYEPVKVTQAVKDRWADERGSMQMSFRTEGGGGRTMRMERPSTDDVEFPPFLPPFEGDAVSVAMDGRVWVRAAAAPGTRPRYDVFDLNGTLVQRVVFPERTQVVGFGNGTVYTVMTDADDLQWLGRYRI